MDGLRVDEDKAVQIVGLFAEGVGVRAISRLVNCHVHTVLAVLEVAGQKCALLLNTKIRNLKCKQVQVDELWAFVGCKQHNSERAPDLGDQYTFLAIDRDSKLIICHMVGKRIKIHFNDFMDNLSGRIDGIFQLSTDGHSHYTGRHGSVEFFAKVKSMPGSHEFSM